METLRSYWDLCPDRINWPAKLTKELQDIYNHLIKKIFIKKSIWILKYISAKFPYLPAQCLFSRKIRMFFLTNSGNILKRKQNQLESTLIALDFYI